MTTKSSLRNFEEARDEAFSIFDAIRESAERYVDDIIRQKRLAVDKLNVAIEKHNKLYRETKEVCLAADKSNEELMKVYERAVETLALLNKRLDELLEEES